MGLRLAAKAPLPRRVIMTTIAFYHNARIPYTPEDLGRPTIKGIESSVLQWAAALTQAGHTVRLHLPQVAAPLPYPTVTLYPLRDRPPADIALAVNEPDVLWNVPAERKFLWLHNALPLEKAMRKGRLWPLIRMKMPVIVSSQWHARTLSPLLRWHGVHVMPLGIADVFTHHPRPHAPPPHVGYITHPYRGLDHYFAMWTQRILPHCPEAQLHLYGPQALNHPSVVHHDTVGWDQLPDILGRLRCVVFPWDKPETFCLAAGEALATGTPVISYDVGAIPEHAGVTAVATPDDFVRATRDYLTDDGLWMHHHTALGAIPRPRWGDGDFFSEV